MSYETRWVGIEMWGGPYDGLILGFPLTVPVLDTDDEWEVWESEEDALSVIFLGLSFYGAGEAWFPGHEDEKFHMFYIEWPDLAEQLDSYDPLERDRAEGIMEAAERVVSSEGASVPSVPSWYI